jgi:5-methylthioadenosine/S-adenosylhomocysteine deaminase
LLILPGWLVTSHDAPPKKQWGLRILDGAVETVAANAELVAAHPDEERFDAPNLIALPGFVNTHVHLYGVLAHGVPPADAPEGLWGFLADYWWPQVEDRLDRDMITAATDWVCAEMLRSGVTTFYDILEAPHALPDALHAEKEIVERFGMRGILSFEATERAGAEIAAAGLAENVALIKAARDTDLVSGLMCFHTTFTCSADFIQEAFALGEEHGVLTHAHANEGAYEGQQSQERYGKSTFEYYRDLGVASPNFLASQCVQLTESDRRIIAESGIRVSHMPLSNCEVGGGIAPMTELHDAGVTIGLGSDGYINDFYEVARGAFLLHKARLHDPGAMPADVVLGMATVGGATALDLDSIGRLDVGWSADLQLVDGQFPTPLSSDNLLDQLVLWRNHSHVRDVMVAGQWRVRDGAVVGWDPERSRALLHEQATRLWQ